MSESIFVFPLHPSPLVNCPGMIHAPHLPCALLETLVLLKALGPLAPPPCMNFHTLLLFHPLFSITAGAWHTLWSPLLRCFYLRSPVHSNYARPRAPWEAIPNLCTADLQDSQDKFFFLEQRVTWGGHPWLCLDNDFSQEQDCHRIKRSETWE